jgi:hypothetical protein
MIGLAFHSSDLVGSHGELGHEFGDITMATALLYHVRPTLRHIMTRSVPSQFCRIGYLAIIHIGGYRALPNQFMVTLRKYWLVALGVLGSG